jgi:hypothetical protein
MEAEESLETYLGALAEFASDNDASAVEVFTLDWEFEDAEDAYEFHFWVGYVTCAAEMCERRPSELLAEHIAKIEESTCPTTAE